MFTILVADDDTAIREFAYDLLTAKGFHVFTATSGTHALELLNSKKPDLVLLDIKIPGETGLSLLKKIQTASPKTPVVIFSAFVTADLEKEAFQAGAAEVVRKGMGADELIEKIKKILGSDERVKAAKAAPGKEKILIVDDEDSIRDFLSDYFQNAGYTVLQAARGADAVKLVKTEKPSVILLDVTMPGMDGLLTLKKIREIDKEVGVVMATSIQDEKIAAEAAQLGSYHYVLKPFDLAYLKLVVTTRLLIAS